MLPATRGKPCEHKYEAKYVYKNFEAHFTGKHLSRVEVKGASCVRYVCSKCGDKKDDSVVFTKEMLK